MTQPNVLTVVVDHWFGRLLGINGHPVVQTPTLDALARNGTLFTRAYSETPVCVPARRTLMTGTTARTHGDRAMDQTLPMPELPTLAQTFRDAGYQTNAVGKLHVFPQRNRIGFDDVILHEEGRTQYGVHDDYESFLAEKGHPGQQFGHGMSNNQYTWRPWHLPEELHATTWATQQMSRIIKRRDPTRPAFWYLSHIHPHPPLVPPHDYLAMYEGVAIDPPFRGTWAKGEELPYALRARIAREAAGALREEEVLAARRAFYALCTHIDHQLRVVIGTLREEGLLDNTIILFTSDHGDMLGNHGLWAKRLFLENSANVPMILLGPTADPRVRADHTDDRLVGLQDVMPTLLELAGIDVPGTVEGTSMIADARRPHLYGEWGESDQASRMLHDGRFKLIYYPVGNRFHLFDLQTDPQELTDLASTPDHSDVRDRLVGLLTNELYGSDLEWISQGQLVGLPDREADGHPDRGLFNQRGLH